MIRYDAFIEDNPEGTLNKVNIAIPMIRCIFSSLIKEEKVTNDSGAGQNDGDVLICSVPKKGGIGNAGCCWLLAVVEEILRTV